MLTESRGSRCPQVWLALVMMAVGATLYTRLPRGGAVHDRLRGKHRRRRKPRLEQRVPKHRACGATDEVCVRVCVGLGWG